MQYKTEKATKNNGTEVCFELVQHIPTIPPKFAKIAALAPLS